MGFAQALDDARRTQLAGKPVLRLEQSVEGLAVEDDFTPEDLICENGLGSSVTTADAWLLIPLGSAMTASSVTYTEREPGFV